MRICDAAVQVLRETGNPAVMNGDGWLLHEIAERADRGHKGYKTERLMLSALGRQPGILQKVRVRKVGRSWWVAFYLPECLPDHLR